jgi:hypothetical protein
MKFQHRITLEITTEEDNPDMPSLNVNALAQGIAAWVVDQLAPSHPLNTIQSATVSVIEARQVSFPRDPFCYGENGCTNPDHVGLHS